MDVYIHIRNRSKELAEKYDLQLRVQLGQRLKLRKEMKLESLLSKISFYPKPLTLS